MTKVNTADLNIKFDADYARFAGETAAEAFGGRYWGWRQWAEFEDFAPAEVDRLRGMVAP